MGLAGGFAVMRLLQGFLYGIGPLHAVTWTAATGALTMVGLCATMVPAMRATRVDPLIALRSE